MFQIYKDVGSMKNIVVSSDEEGQRLDKFLKKYFRDAKSGFLYKMLRKKNIVLNKNKASGSEKLMAGDTISVFMSDETIKKFRGEEKSSLPGSEVLIDIRTDEHTKQKYIIYKNFRIDVLYEDRYVIFFNKPAGILSQRAKKDDISMVEILECYLLKTGQISEEDIQKPGICTRLDRNTSGVMACGKNLKGLQALSEAVKERRVSKYYRCIAEGIPKSGFVLSGYLTKDTCGNKAYISDESDKSGKYICTEVNVIDTYADEDKALLEVKLITGRTHQIRAHLAYKGYPVAGDVKYGAKACSGLKHYLLHACRLTFGREEGILSGVSEKTIQAPLPKEFAQYIQ